MATKAELEAENKELRELNDQKAERIEELNNIVPDNSVLGVVHKSADGDGSVVLASGTLTADEWIEAVAKVSAGGANGANLATIRNVHTG